MLMNPVDPRVPRDAGLLGWQILNYLQYFDWQWAKSVAGGNTWFGMPRPLFTLVFSALGIYGAVTHFKRDRTS